MNRDVGICCSVRLRRINVLINTVFRLVSSINFSIPVIFCGCFFCFFFCRCSIPAILCGISVCRICGCIRLRRIRPIQWLVLFFSYLITIPLYPSCIITCFISLLPNFFCHKGAGVRSAIKEIFCTIFFDQLEFLGIIIRADRLQIIADVCRILR